MANYSIKQSNYNETGSGSTCVVVFTSAQTAGSINVVTVGLGEQSHTISSVVDTKNGTYTNAAPLVTSAAGGQRQAIYYFPNIIAATSSSNTVTVTFSGTPTFPSVRISEFASTNGTLWTVDKTTGIASTGTTPSSGNTAATTNANDLVYGACNTSGGISAYGAGFTGIAITSGNANADEWKEVTGTGAQAATFTDGGSSGSVTQVVAFNAASSGIVLSGTCTIKAATNAGKLAASKPLSATDTAKASTTAKLLETNRLTSTGTFTSSITAKLVQTNKLAATDTLHFNSTASLVQTNKIAATSTVHFNSTAKLIQTNKLSTTDTFSSSITAKLLETNKITATGTLRFNSTASLTQTNKPVAADTLRFNSIANLIQTNRLAATDTAHSSITATLLETNKISATETAHFNSTANLRETNVLSSTCQAKALTAASLLETNRLSVTGAFKASGTVSLTVSRPLVSTDIFRASDSASLAVSRPLEATDTVRASETATLKVSRPLTATCSIKEGSLASLTVSRPLLTACSIRFISTSQLAASKPLATVGTFKGSVSAKIAVLIPLSGSGSFQLSCIALLAATKPLSSNCTFSTADAGILFLGTVNLSSTCGFKGAVTSTFVAIKAVRSVVVASFSSQATLTVTVTRHLSAWVSWETASGGILTGSLVGRCSIQAQNSGSLIASCSLVGMCAIRADSSGTATPILPNLPLQGFCKIHNASLPTLGALKTLAAQTVIKAINSSHISVFMQFTGPCAFRITARDRFGVTQVLSAACVMSFGLDPALQIITLLGGDVVWRGIKDQAALTVVPALPADNLVGDLFVSTTAKGQLSISLSVPVFLASTCDFHLSQKVKSKLSNRHAFKAVATIKTVSLGWFPGPMLPLAVSFSVKSSASGFLVLVGDPVQYRNPIFKTPPIPLIADIQQMPLPMLLAYCNIYELPNRNLTRDDIVANLKAIRWIIQGDASMVTPQEMTTLWGIYQIEANSAVNVSTDTQGKFITQYLFNLFIRHNAWGVCTNGTSVKAAGTSHLHNSVGLCSFAVEVEDNT